MARVVRYQGLEACSLDSELAVDIGRISMSLSRHIAL